MRRGLKEVGSKQGTTAGSVLGRGVGTQEGLKKPAWLE